MALRCYSSTPLSLSPSLLISMEYQRDMQTVPMRTTVATSDGGSKFVWENLRLSQDTADGLCSDWYVVMRRPPPSAVDQADHSRPCSLPISGFYIRLVKPTMAARRECFGCYRPEMTRIKARRQIAQTPAPCQSMIFTARLRISTLYSSVAVLSRSAARSDSSSGSSRCRGAGSATRRGEVTL